MSPPSPTPSPDPGGSSDTTRSSGTSRSAGSARSASATDRSTGTSASAKSSVPSSLPSSGVSATPISTPEPAAPAPLPETEPSPSPGAPTPDPVTTTAVQTALGSEHAAVWCYGLAQAFLPRTLDLRAREDLAGHRARRDLTVRLLTDYGVRPAPAEPAYRAPAPVTDQTSAMKLLVAAESDAAAAWRSVLEHCDDPGLRRMALDGLTEAAVRGGRWSEQLGAKPVVPPFPGRE